MCSNLGGVLRAIAKAVQRRPCADLTLTLSLARRGNLAGGVVGFRLRSGCSRGAASRVAARVGRRDGTWQWRVSHTRLTVHGSWSVASCHGPLRAPRSLQVPSPYQGEGQGEVEPFRDRSQDPHDGHSPVPPMKPSGTDPGARLSKGSTCTLQGRAQAMT